MYDLKATGTVNQFDRDRIIKYIKAEMIKKGFSENKNNPDLMINAVSVVKNKRSLVANTNFYGYGGLYRPYGYWMPVSGHTTIDAYNYRDGSLVIDVVDDKTKKLVWEGNANAQFEKKPKNTEDVISEVVAKLMKSFPVCPSTDSANVIARH